VDLPGYGYAKISRKERERWGFFIGRYLTERVPLRVVFHLIDSRHPPTALDKDVIDVMRGSLVPYVIALTKTDKLSGNGRARSRAVVEQMLQKVALEVPILLTSAKDGRGRKELLQWIDDLAI
jgi:GTP-binding protein